MKKYLIIFICTVSIGLSLSIYAWYSYYENSPREVITDNSIAWSQEWKSSKDNSKQTSATESEFSIRLKGAKELSVHDMTTKNINENTQLSAFLDGKEENITNFNSFSIHLPDRNEHRLRFIYFCNGRTYPCDLSITSIMLTGGYLEKAKNPSRTIAVLGDSISLIYGKDNYTGILARELSVHVRNISVWGGSLTKGGKEPLIDRYKNQLFSYNPTDIIICIGINDVYNNTTIDDFTSSYLSLVTNLKKQFPSSHIILCNLLMDPEQQDASHNIDIFQSTVKDIAQKTNSQYIDFQNILLPKDFLNQLHPNQDGEAKLAKVLLLHL